MLALHEWFQSPAGRYVIEREQAWLNNTVADIFGFRAVQLGTLPIDGLAESRIPHLTYVAEHIVKQSDKIGTNSLIHPVGEAETLPSPQAHILANFEDLPFENQSLDLLVLPHILEFSEDPHQILREVERVLMPEGRVIVTGFNPLSLWGAAQKTVGKWKPAFPASCRPMQVGRLRDLLQLLSIEAETGRFGCYRFPGNTERAFQRFEFMEKAGDRWWPFCGAVYFLCAVKRVRGMRLVGPAFKDKTARIKQLKPVARQGVRKTTKLQGGE